jgi:hypothetical protein
VRATSIISHTKSIVSAERIALIPAVIISPFRADHGAMCARGSPRLLLR